MMSDAIWLHVEGTITRSSWKMSLPSGLRLTLHLLPDYILDKAPLWPW
jgi:hypothetical protein